MRVRCAAAVGTTILVLSLVGAGPLQSQQPAGTAPREADSARASGSGAPPLPDASLGGPRILSRWYRYEARLDVAEPAYAPSALESTHTFRFTTLELILIGVIILLLIVR